jgi:hypothetical protein
MRWVGEFDIRSPPISNKLATDIIVGRSIIGGVGERGDVSHAPSAHNKQNASYHVSPNDLYHLPNIVPYS